MSTPARLRLLAGLLFFSAHLFSQNLVSQDLAALKNEPSVRAALEAARRAEPGLIEDQRRICEIPAPPFHEQARARDFQRLFMSLDLQDVRIDKAGNVIGVRPGASTGPDVVLAAHLDTVFPEGTDVQVTRQGNILRGPGIGDNCRGLAVLIGVIRALNAAQVRTGRSIAFVADVGEEGLGDLRGVRNLFEDSLRGRIGDFVSLDGPGLGVTNTGVGSFRYRVTYRGPGGHSFGSFGLVNPIHALGRAIAKISNFDVPESPLTTYNVGRIGGGTSVNSIPFEAWMEADLRSSDAGALKALDARFRMAVQQALEEERHHASRPGELTVSIDRIGTRPPGETPAGSPIVRAALAALETLGLPLALREGSTDANFPMSLHIPAITIGAGGNGAGIHTPHETFDTTDSWLGTEYALLLTVALAR